MSRAREVILTATCEHCTRPIQCALIPGETRPVWWHTSPSSAPHEPLPSMESVTRPGGAT